MIFSTPCRTLNSDVGKGWIPDFLCSWVKLPVWLPDPSFAHNLGCKCPNDQCGSIFDIYASRPFQWHQKYLNARCFGPCFWTLNIQESRRTPNPQLWKCWASPPHLAKVGLRHNLCICKILMQLCMSMVGMVHLVSIDFKLVLLELQQHFIFIWIIYSHLIPYVLCICNKTPQKTIIGMLCINLKYVLPMTTR